MWTPAERIKICVWLRHLFAKSFEMVATELMDAIGPHLENERDYFTDTPDYALSAAMPVQRRLLFFLPMRLRRGIDTWQNECAEALNVMRLLIRGQPSLYLQFDAKLRNLRVLVDAMEPYYLSTTGDGWGCTGRSWCIPRTNYPSYCQATTTEEEDTDFLHTVFPLLYPHHIFIQNPQIESGMSDYHDRHLCTTPEEVLHFVFHDATLYQLFWDHYLPTLDFATLWEQALLQLTTEPITLYTKEWFHFMEAERLLLLYPKTTKRRFDEMSSGTVKSESAMIDGIPVLYVDDALYWALV